MKIALLIFSMLILINTSFAQTKTKTAAKPPTQKEMEEMMKELQQGMEEMSPEDKKAMEDMGVKMPSLQTILDLTEAQMQGGAAAPSLLVPEKDLTRISGIPKTPLTSSTLPAYLKTTHEQIIEKLSQETNVAGEEIYQFLKGKYNTASAVGNAAVGSWIFGKADLALYIMGRACIDDPADDDNLNNYAALLIMSGGEQFALPLLTKLNTQYPQNSTILNNIAQVWFGLGDLDKATLYINSTLAVCASHPQANMIKARIAESKGNYDEAVTAIKKSIEVAYSDEKVSKLHELGYELKDDDINWERPWINDGLGLTGFRWPAYPKNVEESKLLELKWEEFKEKCSAKLRELEAQKPILEKQWEEQSKIRFEKVMQAGQSLTSASLFPDLAPKAFLKLAPLVKGIAGVNSFVFSNEFEPVLKAIDFVEEQKKIENEAMNALNLKYKDKFGEGKANPWEAHCSDENAIRNYFLNEANTTTEQRNRVYLNYASRQTNNLLYYRLYTQWPDEFALSVLNAQIAWLTEISGQNVSFRDPSSSCQYVEKKDTTQAGKLQEFDVVNCQYRSELNLLFGTINVDCSIITAKLDLSIIKLGVKTKQGDKDNQSFAEQFQNGSVEIGLKKGVSYGKGPLKIEAKGGVSVFLEVGKNFSIKDAGVKIGADVKVGTNILKPLNGTEKITIKDAAGKTLHTLDASMGPFKDLSLSIVGTEAKISINSGFSAEGKFLGMKTGK